MERKRIKRSTIFANTIDGGLGMIDFDSCISSLSAAWVRKYFLHPGTWKEIFKHVLPSLALPSQMPLYPGIEQTPSPAPEVQCPDHEVEPRGDLIKNIKTNLFKTNLFVMNETI